MVHPGEDYLPYTELSSARPLVAFSDIHGHAGPLAHHIECLSHAFHEPLILFVGDAIDYWFPPDLTGKSDWCGERAVSLYGGVLAEAQESLPPLATDDVRAAVRHALDNKPWLGFPVGAVRRAVIGALLSYQALTTLAALPRSAFLLGNHEIDLLSGAWYYRSLQKSFLLNLCGVTGTWCLEYRDYLRANSPITHGHEMSEVRARLLSCSEEVARRMLASYDPMLLWLYSRPVIAGYGPYLIMHGGPTDGFAELTHRYPHSSDLVHYLTSIRQEHSYAPGLFRETTSPFSSFLAPDPGPTHFTRRPCLVESALRYFEKEHLVVGHSAFLTWKSYNARSQTSRISRLSQTLTKLDVGLKHNLTESHHYAVLTNSLQSAHGYCFPTNNRQFYCYGL